MVIYSQHVAFHHIPLFWRIHKIHHIDQEIDVSTGLRFHPMEIIISYLLKSVVILCIGAPLFTVIVFEVVLNIMSMFTHSNLYLPNKLDRYLRFIFVTPDMHRVHHSVKTKETNSNFGFNFSLWDQLFKTYLDQPEKGHIDMEIGLNDYKDYKKTTLWQLILIPFKKS